MEQDRLSVITLAAARKYTDEHGGGDGYTKAEADAKFAEKTTLKSALVDNAAVNRFLVNIDEMVEANTDGEWDTSTDGEYVYIINNADFSVHFNAGGWVTNISGSQTEFNTDFKIYLWKNKIMPTSEFDEIGYTLYAKVLLSGSNVAFHLEQRNRYDTANLWEEIFSPNDTDYRGIEIQQAGSKSYFNAYLQISEESGTASFNDLWVKLIPNVNLDSGLGNDDYFRTQRQLDAALAKSETDIASVQNGLASKLDKTGGQVTGPITTTQTEFTQDQQLVTKKYVDDNAGGNSVIDKLWENSTSEQPATITLTHPYTDYDALLFVLGVKNEDGVNNIRSEFILSRDIAITQSPANNLLSFTSIYGDIGATMRAYFSSALQMNKYDELQTPAGSTWNWHSVVYCIYGIKFGGSVRGRNVTSLFANSGSTNPASITLSSAYTDFDEIVVHAYETSNSTLVERFILSNTLKVNDYVSLQSGDTYLNYLVASTSSFTFTNASGLVISGIYGIKYDSDYITIDSEMSSTSENPVQNKAIKDYIDKAIAAITDYETEVFPNA